MAAVRRERSGHALALGIADLAGAAAGSTRWWGRCPTLPTASSSARSPRRSPSGRRTRRRAASRSSALGKLGGRELNYSSDVDLIFLYDPETLPQKPREEPDQAAVRIGQRVVEILQKRDRRRLCLPRRPAASPLARSDADRAAGRRRHLLLRIGGPALGARRLHPRPRRPPAIRRSAAISSTRSTPSSGGARSITARSARSARSAAASATIMRKARRFGPGYDLKRGRGGIREVEFFVQIHQLIHGGREPELRARGDARRARGAGRGGPDRARRTPPSLRDAYRLAADDRAPAADGRRPPDPQPARRCRRRSTMSPRLHGLADGAALLDLLAPACRARRGALRHARGRRGRPACPRIRRRWSAALAEAGFAEPGAARGADRGLALGQGARAAHRRGARGVRGDAAGADRGVRRRARSDARR